MNILSVCVSRAGTLKPLPYTRSCILRPYCRLDNNKTLPYLRLAISRNYQTGVAQLTLERLGERSFCKSFLNRLTVQLFIYNKFSKH